MKVRLFSHTDLDGYGCNIVANFVYGKENVVATNSHYDTINEEVNKYIDNKEYEKFDVTFITDISVNKETADRINELVKKGYEFRLYDHHKNSSWLNEYNWAFEIIEFVDTNTLTSGTWLLNLFTNEISTPVIDDLVVAIRDYDTWLWKENNDLRPKQLNDLFYILGFERFENELIKVNYNVDEFLEKYKIVLELEQEKIDRLVKDKLETIVESDDFIEGRIGIIFSEQYISELGNKICELRNDIDVIFIINPSNNTVSLRTVKDIDVSLIAKQYGGGGHTKASGFKFSPSMSLNYIDNILTDY